MISTHSIESNKTPSPFLWGVATSGYQCEGGYNQPGQPHNNWAESENSGRVCRSGLATDFWHRYNEDLDACHSMRLNAFRMSIEWSRIQPSFSPHLAASPPPFNHNAIAHYAEILAACRARGMEPIVTLHHFTHPAWLGPDAWLQHTTPHLFVKFAIHSISHINRILAERYGMPPLKWFITINEPNMLVINTYLNRHFPSKSTSGIPIGVKAYNQLLAAHILAYNAIHDLYQENHWPPPRVSLNTFCSDVYWSENLLLDLLESRHLGISHKNLSSFLVESARQLRKNLSNTPMPFPSDPFIWAGRLVHLLTDWLAPRHATEKTFNHFLSILDQSPRPRVLDFIGLDYYDPFIGHIFRAPAFDDIEFPSRSFTGHLVNGLSRKWWDWHVLPEGLQFFVKYYHQRLGLDVLIAENGMAHRCKPDGSFCSVRKDRLTRSRFIEAHIQQIIRLRQANIPVIGYLHWSITDNYEWGSFTPRFGLLHIDYTRNSARCREDPLGDQPCETYKKLIAHARNLFQEPAPEETEITQQMNF